MTDNDGQEARLPFPPSFPLLSLLRFLYLSLCTMLSIQRGLFTLAVVSSALLAAPLQKRVPTWADVETATVHPGVNTNTEGGSCTANFVFHNGKGDVFIGQAAHCSSTGESTSTDGCSSASRPEGTVVQVDGASQPGTMAYNSWIRMQQAGGAGVVDGNACAFNDLALIKLHPADHDKVNPSIPKFGGPTGIRTSDVKPLEVIYAFTNSVLRRGIPFLQPKYGVQRAQSGDGWSHEVIGQFDIPGDSGSGAIDKDGKAVGVLSTLEFLPIPTENGFCDFSRAFDYLRQQPDFSDVQLALGTKEFNFALPIPKK